MSDEDYRELRRITRLWKTGKISKDQFRKLVDEINMRVALEEELRLEQEKVREQKEIVRKEKAKQRRAFRQKLNSIDSLHSYRKRGGSTVQGGLPSLGKRR